MSAGSFGLDSRGRLTAALGAKGSGVRRGLSWLRKPIAESKPRCYLCQLAVGKSWPALNALEAGPHSVAFTQVPEQCSG